MIIDKTDNFASKDINWRIEAVIHDGSWYTVPKWAKLAKTKKNDIEEWIRKNSEKVNLIHVNKSYRVSYSEIMDWYSKQKGISVLDRIVPKNFPPKIWDNQTEVEALINTPRRKVTEVTITPNSHELLLKCKEVLKGVAIVRFYRNGYYRACGLSPNFIEKTLRRGLTSEEFKIVHPSRKTIMHYRELSDFSSDFLNNAFRFYVPFARTMLRSRMSTLQIFLPTKDDIDMQIAMWVMVALRKFDETQPVPFSGYLSRVLAFWPYDLPDEALGKTLSGFQRNRQKAINRLVRDNGDMEIPDDEIIEEMGIDKDKYVKLSEEYRSWLAERHSSEITWENSNSERDCQLIWSNVNVHEDPDLSYSISLGICDTALKTGNYRQALQVIHTIGSVDSVDYDNLKDIDEDFKNELWKSIENNRNNSQEDVID